MADDADRTGERMQLIESCAVDAIRRAAADIPEGIAGDCIKCEEYSGRLVNSFCARCRDLYGI